MVMTDAVEGGAAIAWRLLATLEGGSLLLLTSAFLAYTARSKITNQRRTIKNVLVTNTSNLLGKELTRRLVARGCTVKTVTGAAVNGADSNKADAVVVIGAEIKQNGIDGLSQLVTEDIYKNVKLLEDLLPLVRSGGCVVWACAGAMRGAFSAASNAFDAVLRASLQHSARSHHCEPIWIGRNEDFELVAQRIEAALFPCASRPQIITFSLRNAAQKVTESLGRWLKIVS